MSAAPFNDPARSPASHQSPIQESCNVSKDGFSPRLNDQLPPEFEGARLIEKAEELDENSFPCDSFNMIYRTNWPRNGTRVMFTTFRAAFDFGKQLSSRFGFQLRVKTTGMNRRDGIIYKYICCKKQGLAEHGWKPKGGTRQRRRHSVRCNCRWGCRLIGMRIQENLDPEANVTDTDAGMVWWWEKNDREINHNHPLDFEGIPVRAARSPASPPSSIDRPVPSHDRFNAASRYRRWSENSISRHHEEYYPPAAIPNRRPTPSVSRMHPFMRITRPTASRPVGISTALSQPSSNMRRPIVLPKPWENRPIIPFPVDDQPIVLPPLRNL